MSGTKRRTGGRTKLKAAAGWGLVAVVGLVFYAIGYGITAILIAVGSGVVAGILAALDLRENGAQLDRQQVVATTKKERPSGPTLTRAQSRKLVGSIQERAKQAVSKGQVRTGTFRMTGRACSESCKKSRAPKWACRCSCGGGQHGSARALVPSFTPSSREVAAPSRPRTRGPGRGAKPGIKKPAARQPVLPAGPPESVVTVVWRTPEDKYFQVTTTKATAQRMQSEGRLVRVVKE